MRVTNINTHLHITVWASHRKYVWGINEGSRKDIYLTENGYQRGMGGTGHDGFREDITLKLRTEASVDICLTDIGRKGTPCRRKSTCRNMNIEADVGCQKATEWFGALAQGVRGRKWEWWCVEDLVFCISKFPNQIEAEGAEKKELIFPSICFIIATDLIENT